MVLARPRRYFERCHATFEANDFIVADIRHDPQHGSQEHSQRHQSEAEDSDTSAPVVYRRVAGFLGHISCPHVSGCDVTTLLVGSYLYLLDREMATTV